MRVGGLAGPMSWSKLVCESFLSTGRLAFPRRSSGYLLLLGKLVEAWEGYAEMRDHGNPRVPWEWVLCA